MIHELTSKLGRFIFTLILFSGTTTYVTLTAVPNANKPGLIAASIASALFIAMYDIGVFRVDLDKIDI